MRMRTALAALALSLSIAGALAAAEMRPFVSGSWKQLTGAYEGKPVVVHFWGLTCSICVAEMPDWGRLAAAHPEMQIVLVNWDRRPDKPSRLQAVLDKAGVGRLERWVFAETFEDRLRFEVDPEWMGELPRTYMISRDGSVSAASGALDRAEILTWHERQRAGG